MAQYHWCSRSAAVLFTFLKKFGCLEMRGRSSLPELERSWSREYYLKWASSISKNEMHRELKLFIILSGRRRFKSDGLRWATARKAPPSDLRDTCRPLAASIIDALILPHFAEDSDLAQAWGGICQLPSVSWSTHLKLGNWNLPNRSRNGGYTWC